MFVNKMCPPDETFREPEGDQQLGYSYLVEGWTVVLIVLLSGGEGMKVNTQESQAIDLNGAVLAVLQHCDRRVGVNGCGFYSN